MKNYAFIDAQNLYYEIKRMGWRLDYKRFRIYLKEKYNVKVAYLFMGNYQSIDLYIFRCKTQGLLFVLKKF